ncbi:MAG TPA: FAD-dependent oxidoreductase [Frankiaceae bacterium]|nr:FAD-dependent oxidoreductase [Frankiaceae bacterium]
MTRARRVVVVGNGMAGSRVVEEIRARDRDVAVTVFGAERDGAYNRVLLSNVLAGQAGLADVGLTTAGWHVAHQVDLHLGVPVTGVDRAARVVTAADGTRARYDALVLATGSRPRLPPVTGLRDAAGRLAPGAHAFRTLDDTRRILRSAGRARHAVVAGGGLLGLEAARGLAARGLDVEVVHVAGHLMERQLDATGGAILAATLRGLGVRVRVGTSPARVELCDGGVRGVVLADGTVLACDLLVLACGVRPEVRLAAAAGLRVERGVVVDGKLRSVTDPAVLAVGECAQHDGVVYGLVAPAWEQAAVLADVLTGADPAASYRGSRLVTRLKAPGVQLASLGEVDGADGATEVVQFVDPARGTYKKVLIRDDRLVGAILLGDVATVGTLTQAYERGRPLPADRLPLLFAEVGGGAPAGTPALVPAAATVCVCNGVTKRAIVDCVLAGARTADEVAARTRAGTGCGSCRDAVAGIVDWTLDAEPATA